MIFQVLFSLASFPQLVALAALIAVLLWRFVDLPEARVTSIAAFQGGRTYRRGDRVRVRGEAWECIAVHTNQFCHPKTVITDGMPKTDFTPVHWTPIAAPGFLEGVLVWIRRILYGIAKALVVWGLAWIAAVGLSVLITFAAALLTVRPEPAPGPSERPAAFTTTDAGIRLLKAEKALIGSMSPTKGPASTYDPADVGAAIAEAIRRARKSI
ncbi:MULTISPECIES: hypothetical protein [unclassified Methylobacterium]|uniref:hypothetical protein n=1 Tax=unclassified Methylobacterium TaxID=2615210 RepID=UPI00135532E9|nr:hypothetical protein [Methylobacterium sp. 2A]MWV22433.1 hypothetical protein [Methylobacterium sp. 2A]